MEVTEGDLTFTEIARRAQIVDAAIAALGESGGPGASFGRIAERTGFAGAAIIDYYFATREEFEAEIVAEVRRRLAASNP